MSRTLCLVAKVLLLLYLLSMRPSFGAVAVATLDWADLQVSVFAIPSQPAPGFASFGRQTVSSASSSTPFDSTDSHMHTSFNWTTPSSMQSDTPGAHADVEASSSTLAAIAVANSVPGTPLFYPTITANATGTRAASFTLTGPAALVFSVPYSLAASAAGYPETADARVDGSVTFFGNVGYQSGSQTIDLNSFFGGPANGTLIFGIVAPGAGSGSFTLDAFASAGADFSQPMGMNAVPEPQTILQLLGGLLGVATLAVRRRRAA